MPDPSSSTPNHWHGRCRGGAKTSDGAAYVIAALLAQLPADSKAHAVDAGQDQSGPVLDSIRGERSPAQRSVRTTRRTEPRFADAHRPREGKQCADDA